MQAEHNFKSYNFQPLTPNLLENLRLSAQQYLSSLSIYDEIAEFDKILQAKIQIQKEMVEQQSKPAAVGRGGNNIAQNVKKSTLSLMKRKLPADIYEEMNVRFIKVYNIKSQKENLVLFFLFLEIFFHEQKLERTQITELIFCVKEKIRKYIYNSTMRMESQEWRKEFHEKNKAEFQKFLELDLDFSEVRDFQELGNQIGGFYLRKKLQLSKAVEKIRTIIGHFPCLRRKFYHLEKFKGGRQKINGTRSRYKETRGQKLNDLLLD